MCMVILDDFRIFHPCVSPPGIYFQVGWKQKLPVFINGTFYDFIASADGNCFIVSFHRTISDLFPVTTHINGFSVTWSCDILRVGFCHLVPCFPAFTAKITFDNEVTAAFKQDSDVLSSIISRIQADKERFIRDLTAQSDCLTQEIGCVTLTMLFSFAKLGIDQITFCSDICHDWSVSIIPFVCTGYPFFSGLGIIKRSDINVNRNKTVRQFGGNDAIHT